MNLVVQTGINSTTRREFLKTSGTMAAGGTYSVPQPGRLKEREF